MTSLPVLFEDNHLLAVNKPAGLLTQSAAPGDDNLLDRARAYVRERYNKEGNVYLGLVHRLDRNVSGVVLLARTSKAAARLSKAFAQRDVAKHYLAVVEGVAPTSGQLVHRLGPRDEGRGVRQTRDGKEARLRFERLADDGRRSLLEVRLETGRKHQIRAQLALAGMPLVGDPLYGSRDARVRRPALHGWWLTLAHPVGERGEVSFIAPPPPELEEVFVELAGAAPDHPRLT